MKIERPKPTGEEMDDGFVELVKAFSDDLRTPRFLMELCILRKSYDVRFLGAGACQCISAIANGRKPPAHCFGMELFVRSMMRRHARTRGLTCSCVYFKSALRWAAEETLARTHAKRVLFTRKHSSVLSRATEHRCGPRVLPRRAVRQRPSSLPLLLTA